MLTQKQKQGLFFVVLGIWSGIVNAGINIWDFWYVGLIFYGVYRLMFSENGNNKMFFKSNLNDILISKSNKGMFFLILGIVFMLEHNGFPIFDYWYMAAIGIGLHYLIFDSN